MLSELTKNKPTTSDKHLFNDNLKEILLSDDFENNTNFHENPGNILIQGISSTPDDGLGTKKPNPTQIHGKKRNQTTKNLPIQISLTDDELVTEKNEKTTEKKSDNSTSSKSKILSTSYDSTCKENLSSACHPLETTSSQVSGPKKSMLKKAPRLETSERAPTEDQKDDKKKIQDLQITSTDHSSENLAILSSTCQKKISEKNSEIKDKAKKRNFKQEEKNDELDHELEAALSTTGKDHMGPTTDSEIRDIIGEKIGNSQHNESPKIIAITNQSGKTIFLTTEQGKLGFLSTYEIQKPPTDRPEPHRTISWRRR